jgi:hypothetical protein
MLWNVAAYDQSLATIACTIVARRGLLDRARYVAIARINLGQRDDRR